MLMNRNTNQTAFYYSGPIPFWYVASFCDQFPFFQFPCVSLFPKGSQFATFITQICPFPYNFKFISHNFELKSHNSHFLLKIVSLKHNTVKKLFSWFITTFFFRQIKLDNVVQVTLYFEFLLIKPIFFVLTQIFNFNELKILRQPNQVT